MKRDQYVLPRRPMRLVGFDRMTQTWTVEVGRSGKYGHATHMSYREEDLRPATTEEIRAAGLSVRHGDLEDAT